MFLRNLRTITPQTGRRADGQSDKPTGKLACFYFRLSSLNNNNLQFGLYIPFHSKYFLFLQFGGDNGARFRKCYGIFCSRHMEAVALYKDFWKNDPKFSSFMKVTTPNSVLLFEGTQRFLRVIFSIKNLGLG